MKMALGLIIAAQLIATPAVAVDVTTNSEPENVITYSVEGEGQTREEEFMWFYRTYNGVEQKRLWSITYGHWVTDWIDV